MHSNHRGKQMTDELPESDVI